MEGKSELMSAEETQRKHDEKTRLAPRIASEREGWTPRVIGRLLVLPDGSTSGRRLAHAKPLLDGTYPVAAPGVARGSASRAALRGVVNGAGRRLRGL